MKLKVAKAPVATSPMVTIEHYIPAADAKDAEKSWEVNVPKAEMMFIPEISRFGGTPVLETFGTISETQIDDLVTNGDGYVKRIVGVDLNGQNVIDGADNYRMSVLKYGQAMEDNFKTLGVVKFDESVFRSDLERLTEETNELLDILCGHFYEIVLNRDDEDGERLSPRTLYLAAATIDELESRCLDSLMDLPKHRLAQYRKSVDSFLELLSEMECGERHNMEESDVELGF